MDRRIVIFLFIASSCWSCNARDLIANHVTGRGAISSVLKSHDTHSTGEAQHVEEGFKNEKLCMLCEEFATEALDYISNNKTQSEIINILHQSCSKLHSYKQKCILLVDYYAPLFFIEASKVHAEEFCGKFGLCGQGVSISQPLYKDKCEICHDAVSQALLKLKDPDTEMEIIQLLLKVCNSVGKSAKKCKRLVFEYAPLILVNAEQFLETNDVCTILHVCDSTPPTVGVEEEVSASSMAMHAAS